VKVHKTSEVAEEAMGKAVSMVRNRFPDCSIHARSLSDPVLVPMDAILISQVFINLLENAVKNSPEGVLVMFDMQLENGYARFDVSDQGEGIPADIMNDLFNKHISNGAQAVDSVSGMGIGLSICKTIVDAHDGKIAAVNRNGGGAKFSVFLPLEDRP
jgi:two-component system sensor histidine kinase KdpD